MNTNYKSVGHNNNNDKTNGNVNFCNNNGFQYSIQEMRLRDSAPKQRSYGSNFMKPEPAMLYCDSITQSKYFYTYQGSHNNADSCTCQRQRQHEHQPLGQQQPAHMKEEPAAQKPEWNYQNAHERLPTVHEYINRLWFSGYKMHHHKDNQHAQQPAVEQQKHEFYPRHLKYSSDYQQHYQHYYSHFYNTKPDLQIEKDKSRKACNMATTQGNVILDEPFTAPLGQNSKKPITAYNNYHHKSSNEFEQLENNQSFGHHVLKEKMSNNNILDFDDVNDSKWTMGDEIISDFADVREQFERELDPSLKFRHMKRKQRTQSTQSIGAGDFYDFSPNDDWLDDNINDTAAHFNKQPVKSKFPDTPKKSKTSKRHSPPAHRVLLYNHNSPHLTRFSPSNSRLQGGESKRPLSKSPSNAAKEESYKVGDGPDSNQPPVKPASNVTKEDGKRNGQNIDDISDDDDDYDDLDNVSDMGEDISTDTSDSEDCYRTHVYRLTHPLDRGSGKDSYLSSEASEDTLENPSSLLVPSLFPNVPPYLAFSSNTSKGPEVPAELFRVLKWRVSNVMPKVVRCILTNSGMRLVKKTNDWIGVWGKHMKSPCFKAIRPYQKINHLPGSFKIGRKDACWRNLQKQMNKHGKKDFGFMPKTYIFPKDIPLLRKHWPKYAQQNVKWIIKPPASARGAGIKVLDQWSQIPKRRPLIVQKYIERPLLINGSKFDLRLYVLVTSINPLRVFMYHNGLARFASVKYSDKSDTLNDRCMHLTNYSINKLSSNYSKNEDVNACHGHKWTIKSLWNYLANRGVRTDYLWEALRNLVLRTVMAGEQSINNMLKMNVESKYSCFELFGFDVLLDAELIPWLLEVNISPSLHSELPLDAHVKAPLVQAVLNTALFNIPPKLTLEKQKELCLEMCIPPGPICYDKRLYINYLSRAEKIKHNMYTRKTMEDRDEYINSILENLTPDDVRCLIVAEDELARSAPLERIFPTNQTFKYLKYNETPRYYNRLLDAWETRYSNNRAEGIALLRDYCEDKYHLEVPPPPAKKGSSDDGDTPAKNEAEHDGEVPEGKETEISMPSSNIIADQ